MPERFHFAPDAARAEADVPAQHGLQEGCAAVDDAGDDEGGEEAAYCGCTVVAVVCLEVR